MGVIQRNAVAKNLAIPACIATSLLSLWLAIAVGYAISRAEPHVSVSKTTFDFGRADPGATIRCMFQIHNRGRSNLHIRNIRTNCRCARPRIDRRILGPRETAVLYVAYHAPEHKGRVGSTLVLETNDPQRRYVPLEIVGTLEPRLQIVPEIIDFGRIAINSEGAKRRTVSLYNWSDMPVVVESWTAEPHWLCVAFTPGPTNQRILGHLNIQVVDSPPCGENKARVKVTARSGGQVIRGEFTVLADGVMTEAF